MTCAASGTGYKQCPIDGAYEIIGTMVTHTHTSQQCEYHEGDGHDLSYKPGEPGYYGLTSNGKAIWVNAKCAADFKICYRSK